MTSKSDKQILRYDLAGRYKMLRAKAVLLLMSEEVPHLGGPLTKALFDDVGDMSEDEARAALAEYEATA